MVRGNVGWRVALCGAAVVALFASCVTSRYDVKLEVASTEWQEKIGAFITDAEAKAGTPGGEYEMHKQFYEDMQNSIGGHVARTKAANGSARAVEILELLSKDIENLRKLHESGGKGGLSAALGEPARQAIETELRALNKLQSEYRAGNENG
jgi:hypothetical protein